MKNKIIHILKPDLVNNNNFKESYKLEIAIYNLPKIQNSISNQD